MSGANVRQPAGAGQRRGCAGPAGSAAGPARGAGAARSGRASGPRTGSPPSAVARRGPGWPRSGRTAARGSASGRLRPAGSVGPARPGPVAWLGSVRRGPAGPGLGPARAGSVARSGRAGRFGSAASRRRASRRPVRSAGRGRGAAAAGGQGAARARSLRGRCSPASRAPARPGRCAPGGRPAATGSRRWPRPPPVDARTAAAAVRSGAGHARPGRSARAPDADLAALRRGALPRSGDLVPEQRQDLPERPLVVDPLAQESGDRQWSESAPRRPRRNRARCRSGAART